MPKAKRLSFTRASMFCNTEIESQPIERGTRSIERDTKSEVLLLMI